ncbi:hypothetical protein Chor_007923 [Crotalus horridus]
MTHIRIPTLTFRAANENAARADLYARERPGVSEFPVRRKGQKEEQNYCYDKQDVCSSSPNMLLDSEDSKEQLLEECEEIWKQVEECHTKLSLQSVETLPVSDLKLQKLDHELEMVLSTVNAKNKKLKEDFIREQKWLEEQEQLIECLNQTAERMSNYVVDFSEKRAFQELKSKMLKIKAYKEDILNALGDFLDEHFPLPENSGTAKKKRAEEEDVQLISLHEILESLINKLINTPHDPYITISDSFWLPYIELLLRYGIALRHPEDPNKIRLENFHQ